MARKGAGNVIPSSEPVRPSLRAGRRGKHCSRFYKELQSSKLFKKLSSAGDNSAVF